MLHMLCRVRLLQLGDCECQMLGFGVYFADKQKATEFALKRAEILPFAGKSCGALIECKVMNTRHAHTWVYCVLLILLYKMLLAEHKQYCCLSLLLLCAFSVFCTLNYTESTILVVLLRVPPSLLVCMALSLVQVDLGNMKTAHREPCPHGCGKDFVDHGGAWYAWDGYDSLFVPDNSMPATRVKEWCVADPHRILITYVTFPEAVRK